MGIKLYQYKIPWQNSFREGLIIEEGNRYAEVAPLPGFSKESFQEAKEELLQWVRTKKPATLPSVRWAIECLSHPLDSLQVPLCALGVKERFSVVKLKLGSLDFDRAINLVRSHLHKFQLRLDFNRKWPLQQAIEFCKMFQPQDFLYLEEPVQNFEELIAFSSITHFPIAIDESIHSDWSKLPSLKAIVVKPTIVGTIPQVEKPLDLILSSSYESGIGLLHIAQRAESALAIGLDTVHTKDLLISPIQAKRGSFSWKASTNILNKENLCVL